MFVVILQTCNIRVLRLTQMFSLRFDGASLKEREGQHSREVSVSLLSLLLLLVSILGCNFDS